MALDSKSSLKRPSHNFIKNTGQCNKKIYYYVNLSDFSACFVSGSVIFSSTGLSQEIFSLMFQCDEGCSVAGLDECLIRTNYILGKDPSNWHKDVPSYNEVIYRNISPNIDLKFSVLDNSLKYEIIIHPGGDVSKLLKLFHGFDDCSVAEDGNLLLNFNGVTVTDKKPSCYQLINGNAENLDCCFSLSTDDNIKTYGFLITGTFDETQDIIIDPGLVYSTYLGGSGSDVCTAVLSDGAGNIYAAGNTSSLNFPYRPTPWPYPADSVFKSAFQGGTDDIFITKFNSSGEAVFSTYIGGSGTDKVYAMTCDGQSLYLAGYTNSPDFPDPKTLIGTSVPNNYYCLVMKLNLADLSLGFITLIGGSQENCAKGICIDNAHSIYIAGYTESNDFPSHTNNYASSRDGFVAKLSPNGSNLVYSTYIGGTNADECTDVSVNAGSGVPYVCGFTSSADFPLINRLPYKPNFGTSGVTAFIARCNSAGTLITSTYFGGSVIDQANGIIYDKNGIVFITGFTNSSDFPNTVNPPVPPAHPIKSKAFVSKLDIANPTVTTNNYSTFPNTNNADVGNRITIDKSNSVPYVTGYTSSTDFPVTNSACQSTLIGTQDAFVLGVYYDGHMFGYASYLGGAPSNNGLSIFYMGNYTALIAGSTSSQSFPITKDSPPISNKPFQASSGGGTDGFVTKLIMISSPVWPNEEVLTASNIGITSLDLAWSPPASDQATIIGYAIFQNGTLIATVAENVSSFHVTGLAENTLYHFKVEAGNSFNVWTEDGPSTDASTLRNVPSRGFSIDDLKHAALIAKDTFK